MLIMACPGCGTAITFTHNLRKVRAATAGAAVTDQEMEKLRRGLRDTKRDLLQHSKDTDPDLGKGKD